MALSMKSPLWGICLSIWGIAAQAAGNSDALNPTLAPPDACRLEVSKFEQAIGFIRQTQGNKVAGDLKEKLLPAKVESDILLKDGYCGLAKYLHDKHLDR